MTDQGKQPYVVDIEHLTVNNGHFRDTVWTGAHLQMTIMSLEPGEDIGLEVHDDHDQFLRIEQGSARVEMGTSKDKLDFQREVSDDWAVLVPAGYWHNVTNVGDQPLKIYSLYGPPDHQPGTVHHTKADALADPHEH